MAPRTPSAGPSGRGDSGNRAEALAARIDQVLTLPVVVQQVIDLTHNPSANARMLAQAIGADPVLAAKVLRTANSSFFGFLSKTADIGSAVVRLGVRQVRNVAMALSVGKIFSGPAGKEGYSRAELWKHSIAVGTMNEAMTAVCPAQGVRQVSGEALLAGLVHDIGIILEDQYLPHKFPEVPPLAFVLKESLPTIEAKEFGFTHAELGGLVLRKWKFAESIVRAVELHHGGEGIEEHLLACMTAMSELLVARIGVGYCDCQPERISQEQFGALQRRLGLMGPAIATLRTHFGDRIGEALELFALEPAGSLSA
jgi:putative nucleotidyltransferase with HDIG domain